MSRMRSVSSTTGSSAPPCPVPVAGSSRISAMVLLSSSIRLWMRWSRVNASKRACRSTTVKLTTLARSACGSGSTPARSRPTTVTSSDSRWRWLRGCATRLTVVRSWLPTRCGCSSAGGPVSRSCPIGAHTLKGVDDPVELWSVEDAAHETDPGSRGAVPFPAFLERAIPEHLVGRAEQLSQLDAAYAAAATSVQLAAVIGEPGIGKTSLTSLWCRAAADGGAVVVAGRCTPDAALPYQPFVEVARAVLGANPQKLLEIGPAAGNVARLVPGIQLPKGLPVPTPDGSRHDPVPDGGGVCGAGRAEGR